MIPDHGDLPPASLWPFLAAVVVLGVVLAGILYLGHLASTATVAPEPPHTLRTYESEIRAGRIATP